jgi:hypothetical protein
MPRRHAKHHHEIHNKNKNHNRNHNLVNVHIDLSIKTVGTKSRSRERENQQAPSFSPSIVFNTPSFPSYELPRIEIPTDIKLPIRNPISKPTPTPTPTQPVQPVHNPVREPPQDNYWWDLARQAGYDLAIGAGGILLAEAAPELIPSFVGSVGESVGIQGATEGAHAVFSRIFRRGNRLGAEPARFPRSTGGIAELPIAAENREALHEISQEAICQTYSDNNEPYSFYPCENHSRTLVPSSFASTASKCWVCRIADCNA